MQSSIPSDAELRKEIIQILIAEWHFDKKTAERESESPVFFTARRSYHFDRALGQIDRFAPSFPRTHSDMFATYESTLYWLGKQTWEAFVTQEHYDNELKRRGTFSAEKSAEWKPRRALLKRYGGSLS